MTAQTVRELLAQHPFLKDFRPQQIDRLAALARKVSFTPDQIIFREGEESTQFFLIGTGRVGLEMVVRGSVLRIQTLSDGDEFGWSAMITGQGKYFQARALQDVTTFAFDGSRLLDECRSDPDFGFRLMYGLLRIVSERLQGTRLQLIDTYSPVAARAGA